MLEMRDNVCIFSRITCNGEELPTAYLNMGNYIETLELDSPKLILEYRDTEEYFRNKLRIKEYDEIAVTMAEPWETTGATVTETFVVLTCKPSGNSMVRMNCMAKPVFNLKQMAEKGQVFQQRIQDIVREVTKGGQVIADDFGVVVEYHLLPGMRPSAMLRKMAAEHGTLLWYDRGKFYLRKFATLASGAATETFHWGTNNQPNHIFKYQNPSKQIQAEEQNVRSFSGWDEVKDRVGVSLELPIFKTAKAKPVSRTSTPNQYILGNATVARKSVVDFLAHGKLSVVPGNRLHIVWNTGNPACPKDEGLPADVVVESVSHWYSTQKYYIRVKGAVPLESH